MPDAGGGNGVSEGKGWTGKWTFRCYETAAGNDKINEWYSKADDDVQGSFDAVMEILAVSKRWTRPEFDVLKGGCAGLGEIRFHLARGQYRVLAVANFETFECVLLYPFKKGKDNNADYRTACREAKKRKREVEKDGSRAKECVFPPAVDPGPEVSEEGLS